MVLKVDIFMRGGDSKNIVIFGSLHLVFNTVLLLDSDLKKGIEWSYEKII